MRTFLFLIFFLASFLQASIVQKAPWPQGESFLHFLEHHGMPQSIYWNLDKEDKELCEEIRAGVTYYTMTDDNGSTIEQVLIPINEELQIHLVRDGDGYRFEMIPVAYEEITDIFALPIERSPYQDIIKATNNRLLAYAFVDAFKNSFDFTRLRKGDMVAVVYKEKLRLGHPYGLPTIEAAMIEKRKKPTYLFRFKERYYDEKGREVEGFLFRKPVNHVRITSRFTLRRWHPVLHRYRAHLGVDFGGRTGTPIYAAADGRIIFAGRLGGYGNVIKIRHRDGFMTLYAHMHKFRRGMRRGKYVKKGQVIGYIGSTGMSTGPHLHFGLYKNGRPINPLGVIKVTKKTIYGKTRKEFLHYAKIMKEKLQKAVETKACPVRLDDLSKTDYCIDENASVGG
ncbi:peptidoglycan DD-metalloendopeptidase family protein [Hydrogenimonas cancrithermarum]|uniref:Membrane protein n=1 Tax=Hydrogenimonas cancrithermarum TaxID=2993563 RepID=A0ABM8G0L9_9BACT|nr:peptidoglycan DD-metalloendopeptidase family protein [Hydrogenimonas cancrithermarum]BDY12660.1 membrane protein [Hydrogenimonas cancrithermarum]